MQKVGIKSGRSSSPEVLVQQWVWRYWGRTLVASSAVHYQQRFRLDVNNLALVLTFNF